MQFDNPVKIAFIISVFFHSFLFFALPAINILLPKRPAQKFEITYYKSASQAQEKEAVKQPPKQAVQKSIKAAQPDREKLLVAAQKKIEQAKQAHREEAALAQKKEESVVIPPLPKGVAKMPVYLDYVQAVREKIRRAANSRYKQIDSGGEVLLNFVLLSDGRLSAIKIVNERSCQKPRLRGLAREAVELASPFQAFPQDLEYKQLSFSVVISFE